MFLATQHLPFCGRKEDVIYKQRKLLELLELLSNCNPILKDILLKLNILFLLKGE